MIRTDVIWWVVIPLVLSAVAVVWAYPLLLRLAHKKNFVDAPNWRRLNKRPVAVMGGVVVFFGMMFSIGVAGCFVEGVSVEYYLVAAMAIILLLGVADDAVGLTPRLRLAVEAVVLAMVSWLSTDIVDTLYGLWYIWSIPEWLALGVTLFGGVGVINAVNLIDGVDGLCAGYGILLAAVYGVMFLVVSDSGYALLAFALLGALLPFWVQNVYGGRRKMFLGDGGSLLLGLLTVVFVVRLYNSGAALFGGYLISLSLAMVALPLFDTLRVMSGRMLSGHSPFSPDCSHLHHSLVRVGMSHKLTSGVIISLQVVVVAIWLCCWMLDVGCDAALYTVAAFAVVLTWGTYRVAEGVARRVERAELNRLTEEIE